MEEEHQIEQIWRWAMEIFTSKREGVDEFIQLYKQLFICSVYETFAYLVYSCSLLAVSQLTNPPDAASIQLRNRKLIFEM